ncbi:Clp protease N-terminal domain-containing protein [Conexibacter sp. CPCC 206217]|uniref:Clp protease N-terminal domain-containing protein n=1 Tax=Conexibacter sp. CPCC 206217 TaxID=3064574 RepID=UPI00271BAAAF|nr:Clp protease N-terminal domain-containing protein [Conexibacter sp. CPCC 206217]MDO8213430.1 Clp protease N-terminal domain-containing protein [Conexibacter sp. CPCC 206217]
MFERFARDARVIVTRAHEQAEALGSPTLEAEHMLLAIAADPNTPTARLLSDEGLHSSGLLAALEREQELSLAAAGVTIGDFELPARPPVPRRKPGFAASSKRAMERAVRIAVARGDRRIGATHVLLGVLRADVGTVPRALAAAGVDRIALATRAERSIG